MVHGGDGVADAEMVNNPQYDSAQGNGQTNPSHMPPPPRPPVVIPQNTNPIPSAITSPMSGTIMSPTSAGGYVRRAAPEPNKRALYVGGLDVRVTEDILRQIFETTGHVVSVKIIPDKNVSCVPRAFTLLGIPSSFDCPPHFKAYSLTLISSIARDITTDLSSTTTPARPKELCRLSMDDGFTSRYVGANPIPPDHP